MSDEAQNLPERSQTFSRGEVAFMMKRRGMSLSDIAGELNIQPDSVNKLIQDRFAAEAQEQTPEERQSILAMQNSRYEFMLARLWDQIEYGEVKAVLAGMQLVDRIVKLNRLDTPEASSNQAAVLVVSGEEADYIMNLKTLVDD